MAEPTQFDLASAARVARVVRTVEDTGPRAKPLTFDRVDEPGSRKVFRVVTIDSGWNTGVTKTVTFYNQTSTPNTVSALNLLFDVSGPSGTSGASTAQVCIIGKEGTGWYFVNADDTGGCDGKMTAKRIDKNADTFQSLVMVSGGSGPQVLLNDRGCSTWVKLKQKAIVENVEWDEGIRVTKKIVWVIDHESASDRQRIVGITEC